MLKILKVAFIYFVLVFGVGFVLGTMRVLIFVPLVGERWAELGEMPLMLLLIYFVARWIVQSFALGLSAGALLLSGVLALVFLLVAEFVIVLGIREVSLGEYIDSRDVWSGAAYLLSLLYFACLPYFLRKRWSLK